LKKIRDIALCTLLLAFSLSASEQAARKIVYKEEPAYPEMALKMALHGTVKIKIWIAPNGSVRRLEYVGGHPLLAQSALKAIKNWKFETAEKESTEIIEVKF
jgi:TonB family protein